jgi:hypothetical protein
MTRAHVFTRGIPGPTSGGPGGTLLLTIGSLPLPMRPTRVHKHEDERVM